MSTAALEQYLTATQDIERGPDGDLYITGMHHISTINGTDDQAQVLRCDGQTGGIPPSVHSAQHGRLVVRFTTNDV